MNKAPITHEHILLAKRLSAMVLILGIAVISVFVLLQPAATSAQDTSTTIEAAAKATPLGPTPTPRANKLTPTPQSTQSKNTSPAAPGVGVMSNFNPVTGTRGYYDLVGSYYSGQSLTGFLFAKYRDTPLDFYQACWNETDPFTGCKLVSELPTGAGYSVRWQGGLWAPAAGVYTFTLANVDDGGRIYLDGTQSQNLIANWGWDYILTPPATGSLWLAEGEHTIAIDFQQRAPYVIKLQVLWSGPTFADEVIPFATRRNPDDQHHDKGCPVCGNEESQDYAGDPINTSTGNFNYQATDLSIATAGRALRFERSYNDLTVTGTAIYSQPMGYGWTHNYDMRLTFPSDPGGEPDTVIFKIPHGSRARFTDPGNGTYEPWPGVRATLTRSLTSPYVYTVTVVNHEAYVFTDTGRLISQFDPKGNQTTLTYQDGVTLTRVTAPGGARWLDFGYDSPGRLISITDHTGRSVGYGYNASNDLAVVTDTRGLAWTYTYTDSHLLSTIIDPDGHIVERVLYDDKGHATRQEDGLGNPIITIDYSPGGGRRVVTERGKIVTDTYNFDNLWVGQVFAAGSTANTFDDSYNRTSNTDGNGHTTQYDRTPLGLTTAVTDALSNTMHLEYDANNNLTAYTDPAGNTTRLEYDSSNNLIAQTDALSHTTRYAYDQWGHVISTTTPGGQTTLYGYDEIGQQIAITDPSNLVTHHGYDALGRLITTTAPNGLVTINAYDNADRLIRVTANYTTAGLPQNYLNDYNLITEYGYDAAGRQVAITDTVGHVSRSEYDAAGQLVKSTQNYLAGQTQNYLGQYNIVTRYGYDTYGRQVLVTDTLGYVTKTDYDSLSRPIVVTTNYSTTVNAQTNVTRTMGYDANGNVITQTDTLGRKTVTQYDAVNRPITTTANYVDGVYDPNHPDEDLSTVTIYDEAGRAAANRDAAGNWAYSAYDELGRLITSTNALSGTTVTVYNEAGQRSRTQDTGGNWTAFEYDEAGRLITTTNALSGTNVTVYDSLGRRTASIDALGHTPVYTYGLTGRLIATADPGGAVTRYEYDVLGRTTAITDDVGRATRTQYDELGRVVTVTNALSGTTVIQYDALGRRLKTQDANGNWTTIGYDSLGRVITTTDATGRAMVNAYDRLGNVVQTSSCYTPTSVCQVQTRFEYDRLGRLIAQSDALTNTTRYAYDAPGNRTTMTNANGIATQYGYDALSRLISVTENYSTTGPSDYQTNLITRYGYDAAGNRTAMTNARGYTTTYTYDALNRPISVADPLDHSTRYGYDAVGNRVVMTDANNEVTLYAYDALNRPLAITYTADLTNVHYLYDGVGNRRAMTDSAGATQYAYDDLNRLTAVIDPFGQTVGYVYDANSNRTQLMYPDGKVVTTTYDAANRLTSVIDWSNQSTTYAYDTAGRLVTTTLPNGVQTVYTYDTANRLIRLTHTRSGGRTIVGDYVFELDALGNRLTVTETLLSNDMGSGGQWAALPPTMADEIVAAVTGHRPWGLNAMRVTSQTMQLFPDLFGTPALQSISDVAAITPDHENSTASTAQAQESSSDQELAPQPRPRGWDVREDADVERLVATPGNPDGANSIAARPDLLMPLAQTPTGLNRHEENDGSIVYAPSAWTRTANSRASRGYYSGSNTAGRTATLTFDGTWVGVGFLVSTDGGQAEVFIDGASRGIVDNYSRYENVTSVYYRDLVSATHTLSVSVLSTHHANSSGYWVRLDYIDTWNIGDMADGSFEENDSRVISSTNWTRDGGYAGASGGYYYRDGSNVWFPFSGDSVAYQAVAISWGGEVEVLVDGQLQGYVDLKSSTTVTKAVSFGNLGSGPHVLQVRAYRGRATVDRFVTPGAAPYYQPPVRSGVVRYEEDDAAVRYSGSPFSQMPQSWVVNNDNNYVSDGYYAQSATTNQTVSLVFTGTWVGFGYMANTNTGQVDVSIDGVSRGTVDTYARWPTPQSVYYNNLASSTHTITLKVLGTRHPNSTGYNFNFDYFDAWDGTSIPDGQAETPFAMTWNWTDTASGVASGGRYYNGGIAVWQAFTGDSITYQGLASTSGGEVEVSVDGLLQGYVGLKSSTTVTKAVSFGNLNNGPHVLQVRAYRGTATVDAFITPGAPPYYQPPVRSGIVRYEEDDAAVRYSGSPYLQMPAAWNAVSDANYSSDGYYAQSSTTSQTVSLVFTGTWAGFGYVASTNTGQVDVSIDGVSRGTVDTYARWAAPQSVYYTNLASGTHTMTLRVLSTRHPNSTGYNFNFDYFDVWDGTTIPQGQAETPFAMTWNWVDAASGVASGGRYYYNGVAMWQAFTGDSITYQGLASTSGGEVEVRVDGLLQGFVDLKSTSTVTKAVSFGNLVNGPHVLQVRAYRGTATVDAFITPGTPPYYQPPVRSGIIRYEEDDAAVRYSGSPYLQMPQAWVVNNDNTYFSDGYYAQSNTVSQTVSLVFTGTWAGFGYVANTNTGQVDVSIDGVSRGTVDTYAASARPQSAYYSNLASGTHTITLRILSTRNPLSTGYNFNFDYFDTWDGAPLPRGQAEAPFAKTWNWTEDVSTVASTGRYFRDGTAMWSAFTSDHVIYQALATSWAGQVEVSIDGITREVVSLVNPTTAIRTFAYTNLGSGPHILQVRLASGRATVDAFITSQTVIRYTYDPLSRLTGATYSGDYTYTFAYAYDAVGNRTAQTQTITSTQVTNYVYDAANRLTSVNGQAYTWDDNGNLVGDGSKTYTYDQANRLTAVSGQSSAVTYMYNSEGARFKQVVNGSPTTYTLDLAAPLVQALVAKDNSGDTRYLYGVTRIGEQQTGGWVYHLSDALGSVRQLADANAQVVLARGYTPYGELLWAQGTASSRYAFTGEDYDQSVGLLFLRARYMQPTLGIFLSRDPWNGNAMRPGSMNGWNYTQGNPTLFVDPSGKWRLCALHWIFARKIVDDILATAPNAAEKLFRLFENGFEECDAYLCAGVTAGDRLEYILDITQGLSPNTGAFGLPLQFGIDFGGDIGFAEEFRDSGYYDNLRRWHEWSPTTNQVGHFLTAVALAYRGLPAGFSAPVPNIEEIAFIVGHEKVSDDAHGRGAGEIITLMEQINSATFEDIRNFLAAVTADAQGARGERDSYLQAILNISVEEQENRVGNSMEDLRLSVKGWRFGKIVQENRDANRMEAAYWLRANIGVLPSTGLP